MNWLIMNRNVFLFCVLNTFFFFLNLCHIGWCIRTGVGFGLRHTLSQSGLQRIPQKSSIIFRTAKQSIPAVASFRLRLLVQNSRVMESRKQVDWDGWLVDCLGIDLSFLKYLLRRVSDLAMAILLPRRLQPDGRRSDTGPHRSFFHF